MSKAIELQQECEQLRVQLAGCLTAAEGHTNPEVVATEGDYGWSLAYQRVLELAMAMGEATHQRKRAERIAGCVGLLLGFLTGRLWGQL